jgi:hypothetical protein
MAFFEAADFCRSLKRLDKSDSIKANSIGLVTLKKAQGLRSLDELRRHRALTMVIEWLI